MTEEHIFSRLDENLKFWSPHQVGWSVKMSYEREMEKKGCGINPFNA